MHIWFWASVLVLLAGCVVVAFPRSFEKAVGAGSSLTPFRVMVAAMAVAVYLFLYPVVAQSVAEDLGLLHTAFATLFVTTAIFAASGDIGSMLDQFRDAPDVLTQVESLYAVFLFALAPVVALVFVLSFFQAVSAHIHYLIHRRHDVNVFSALNDRSLALAESIRANDPNACIVFTGVFAGSRYMTELLSRTRRLRAIHFKNSVTALPPTWLPKSALMRFFVIGEDDAENLWHATSLLADQKYQERNRVDLYVFSDSAESELVLREHPGNIRARRISPARTLVYNWLWRERSPAGRDLFDGAVPEGPDKVVSAVVVGLGTYGMEMLRALAWYTQMDCDGGVYRLRLHAFDQDPAAVSRFTADCPELAGWNDARFYASGVLRQDANYEFHMHGSVDATGPQLAEHLSSVTPVTFVFVSLGDDALNVRVAITLRRDLARRGQYPQIVVVRSSKTREQAMKHESMLASIPSAEAYRALDSIDSVFSQEAVIRSAMELNGLVCHQAWASREPAQWKRYGDRYWGEEYYYRSSIAVPIHCKARRYLGIHQANLAPAQRDPEERDRLGRLEHARWCAFMRSEGFVYGPEADRRVARTHDHLVPFDALDIDAREKDDNDARDTLMDLEVELEDLRGQGDDSSAEELSRFIDEVDRFVDRYPSLKVAPSVRDEP